MTYEEARALIQEHLDYGGSLDSHGLAVAMSAPSASIADTAGVKAVAWPVPESLDHSHDIPHAVVLRFEDADDADTFLSLYSKHMGAAPPAPSVAETGYAFRCDGRLWVVTDPEVAEKWKAQGFEVTPVVAPSVADAANEQAPRLFTAEQIAALRVAADALIERYAEPIRAILSDAEVADAAGAEPMALLDSIIHDMENGFVRCENCGEQEDTKTLDFMPQLRELRMMLAKESGND